MRISGVILAGGRGSRLGGADKGLVPYAGRPLIEWLIARVGPQVDELLINANRNADRYAHYGYRVVTDLRDDFAGPLAGLQAGLSAATHELVLCVPCDTPALPLDLASRLGSAIESGAYDAAIATTAKGWQPTVCLIHRRVSPALAAYLDTGGRRARDWIASQRHVGVYFEDSTAFVNLNDPASLADSDNDSNSSIRTAPRDDE